MNAFESGERKNVPAVLVYVECDGKTLMIHRNSPDRPGDYHAGKWNGLGGKCEKDESYLEAAARELAEESGLALPLDAFAWRGLLQFPNFKAHKNEDWTVAVFSARATAESSARVAAKNPEGELHWVPTGDLGKLNLWPGDRHFMPLLARGERFFGSIWYAGSEVVRADVRALV